MSRANPISNRNIRIIATYVKSKIGDYQGLFEDLPYPSNMYDSPEAYFLNEDEWTTYENFIHILK